MIQVIHRAFDILELCARNPERILGLSEIADEFELNHSTCANILKTLVRRNYIEQVGYKKGYRLGAMAYHLTGNFSFKRDLVQAAKIPMEELTEELNETCLIGILRKTDFKRVVLYQVPCNQELTVSTMTEKDIYNTTSGRILLGYLPEKELDALVAKFGLPDSTVWAEASTRLKLDQELRKIRQTGFSIQNTSNQIIGLAVPILKEGMVIASLSVYLPEVRYKRDMKVILLNLLKQAAQQISDNLANINTKF
jgi:IclR family transcriptional regulator, KDG regulon repressor